MNHFRRITSLMIAVAIVANGSVFALATKNRSTPVPLTLGISKDTVLQQPTIDGAKNPELIPEQAAYRLFLRFLSGRKTEVEKNRARSYLRMILAECRDCNEEQQLMKAHASYKREIDALFNSADEYARKVSVFEDEAKKIRDGAVVDDVEAELNFRQRQKEAVSSEIVAALSNRAGAEAASKIQRHINEVFKRKVKITQVRKNKKIDKVSFGFMRAMYNPLAMAQSSSTSETYTYSDSWYADNTGIAYNPEDESFDIPETLGVSEVVGAGVTEADLDSEVVSVATTLRAPDGRVTSLTEYDAPSYTRVEVGLIVNSPTEVPAEGTYPDQQFDVETKHRYRVYAEEPMPQDPYYYQASYKPGATTAHPVRPLYYWWYFTSYSYFYVVISLFAQAMAEPWLVERWYYGQWTIVCEYQRPTCNSGCGFKRVRSRANWNHNTECAPYLQTIGFRQRSPYWGFCFITYMLPIPNPGVCR